MPALAERAMLHVPSQLPFPFFHAYAVARDAVEQVRQLSGKCFEPGREWQQPEGGGCQAQRLAVFAQAMQEAGAPDALRQASPAWRAVLSFQFGECEA